MERLSLECIHKAQKPELAISVHAAGTENVMMGIRHLQPIGAQV